MAVYQINKGIGRSPEFKGLRSQYLFIFAKYGEWGLMKMQAAKNHPRYIISRKRFLRLTIPNLKNRKS